eukprot:scaffold1266_cov134-Pinguiococcus_pyrenoidosus.AAC.1
MSRSRLPTHQVLPSEQLSADRFAEDAFPAFFHHHPAYIILGSARHGASGGQKHARTSGASGGSARDPRFCGGFQEAKKRADLFGCHWPEAVETLDFHQS